MSTLTTELVDHRDANLLKAIEAKKLTGLEICRDIADSGRDAEHFLALARTLRASPRQTVRDLTIVRMAIGMAESSGLRVANLVVDDSAYANAYELTDAGRFVLRTAVTGPKAHALLDEIDAEMAGEA